MAVLVSEHQIGYATRLSHYLNKQLASQVAAKHVNQ
jgi:hypothetical protein